jgi:hypothetical protein
MSCKQRRLLRRLTQTRNRCNNKVKSITTEGLHRRYSINLRAIGRFVRRNQAPTHEERRLRFEVEKLRNDVFQLTREVQALKRQNPSVAGNLKAWPVSNHFRLALKRNGKRLCGRKIGHRLSVQGIKKCQMPAFVPAGTLLQNKPQPEPRVTQRRKTGAGNLPTQLA